MRPDEPASTAAPGWLFDGMAQAFRDGAARLAIVGDDPTLLAGQDPAKVARANRARSMAYRPALELIAGIAINWTLVALRRRRPGPAAVFPDLRRRRRRWRGLWDAIFAASRGGRAGPGGGLGGSTTPG